MRVGDKSLYKIEREKKRNVMQRNAEVPDLIYWMDLQAKGVVADRALVDEASIGEEIWD